MTSSWPSAHTDRHKHRYRRLCTHRQIALVHTADPYTGTHTNTHALRHTGTERERARVCVYGPMYVPERSQQRQTGQHEIQQRPRPIIANLHDVQAGVRPPTQSVTHTGTDTDRQRERGDAWAHTHTHTHTQEQVHGCRVTAQDNYIHADGKSPRGPNTQKESVYVS
jgi:hypothetical protein